MSQGEHRLGDSHPGEPNISSQAHWLYGAQVKLADQNATQSQLEESFRQEFGLSGSTLRKAIKFFLDIADYVGMPRSPHWRTPARPPRSSSGGSTKRAKRKRRPVGTKEKVDTTGESMSPPAARGSQSVALRSGGSIVLSMSVDLFSLDRADREFVFDLIDRMRGYDRSSDQGGEP